MPKTYSDAFACYEEIGGWLAEEAPEPWDRIVVDFEIIVIDDVSEKCIVYFLIKSPKKEKQFFIRDTNFSGCFFQLARLTSTPEKGMFKKCRFELGHSGEYRVSFEY